jgi:hypothetical protein
MFNLKICDMEIIIDSINNDFIETTRFGDSGPKYEFSGATYSYKVIFSRDVILHGNIHVRGETTTDEVVKMIKENILK